MLQTDKRYKGTDASNLHDEEVAEDEREWSDDEAERLAKKKRKGDTGSVLSILTIRKTQKLMIRSNVGRKRQVNKNTGMPALKLVLTTRMIS